MYTPSEILTGHSLFALDTPFLQSEDDDLGEYDEDETPPVPCRLFHYALALLYDCVAKRRLPAV